MDSPSPPYPVSLTYGLDSSELTECLRNFIDVYGEDVDPKEVWESVTKVHGFDVEFETVKEAMDRLRRENSAGNEENEASTGEGDMNIHVSYNTTPRHERTLGRRKVKLTEDILKIVSTTLDEEDVHSLLSLKRALELKGVIISKTSVYRALEKLGRSIVEKKKKLATRATISTSKTSPKTGRPIKVGPRTVAEMLAKQTGREVPSGSTKPGSLIVTTNGKTMILAQNQPQLPQKKLRALLPKPTSSMKNSSTVPGMVTTQSPFGTNGQKKENIGAGLMQITNETITTSSSPMTAVASTTAVLRTQQQVLALTGAAPSIGNTIIPSAAPHKASPSAATTEPEKKSTTITQGCLDSVIKIEIDDPSYSEGTHDHHPVMNTVTPPPRTSDLHSNDGFHHSERLTKSVSPQLMSSSYDSYARMEKDAKGRAIQQFRLNKAIGKITNMRSQGQASRAPRKPSVVFHRPSSNSTPIPFRVRHEPSSYTKSSQQQDGGRKQSQHSSLHGQSNGRSSNQFKGRPNARPGQRTLQMMRAARNAQIRSFMRSGLHKLHPTNLSGGRVVSARRLNARLQRHEAVSPLYYQSDMDEEDFLTELEIDPPDNYGVTDEVLTPNSEERQETRDSGSENGEILKDMFRDMTKEMRRLSQHMETIQGQLQLIVEQMPAPLVHRQRLPPSEVRHFSSNGHHIPNMEIPSPVSNDDHSPDTVDDTDDNTTENTHHNQESPPSTRESRDIPTLGTAASDALIREVLDDVRWEQMTPHAGAPRLAIALARYCIFGTKVLMESSVTGRNSKNPLNNVDMKKIKDLLREKYGNRCNQLEFEMVWKTSRESISQLCKRLRRKYQMTGRVSGGQEDYILDSRQ